ncbi:MAG: GNAT family N-acetyltransferase [Methanobacteriaceae archaeon]|jgi:ribosomal protein S18 acetylase RimI-like enzyme|nr:MAG: GNAT family N-acetyltransferase [Methanobacterium sp. BRmetb2]MCC7557695.1 GNAT family N-acetyltransferase [Methanobacteriaceae archaeon]
MEIQKLNLMRHDTLKVSELIYETDTDLFDFFFRDKENAAKKIEKLVRAGNNGLSFERIMVVIDNNKEVQGVLVYSCGDEAKKMDEFKVLRENLNLWDVLKFTIMEWWDSHFLADLNEEDFYLACVAVDEEARGKGIGTFILKNAIEIARKHGFKRAVLDVDLDNKGAYRLYKRMGFKVFNKNAIPWIGGEKGALNMQFLI